MFVVIIIVRYIEIGRYFADFRFGLLKIFGVGIESAIFLNILAQD